MSTIASGSVQTKAPDDGLRNWHSTTARHIVAK